MSDPIEINKRYREFAESEDFISYDRLAGGEQVDEDAPARKNGGTGQAGTADSKADEILRQAREERDRILAEQEELKKKAYEEGFASGREEGRRQGREEFTEKIDSTVSIINELAAARKKLAAQYEAELLDLVKVMVERLVQQQIDQEKPVIHQVLSNALEYIVESTSVTVKLNKADLERLNNGSGEGELFAGEGRRSVELVEDDSVSAGGCLVVTGSGEVDATLENRRNILFEAVDRALEEQRPKDGSPGSEDG